MVRACLAMVLALGTATAQAKLDIQNVEAAYGLFGPPRSALDLYPHDEVLFRFLVTGAQVDAEGKIDARLTLKLTDSAGKVLLQERNPLKGTLALGGQAFSGNARLNVGERLPPGEYTFTVTVEDALSGEAASFQRQLTAKPHGFKIVAPQFFFDADGKVAAPAGGVVGQTLHFRLRAIGFSRDQDKIHTAMNVQVFDAEGRETMPKPITAELRTEDAAVVPKVTSLNFNGNLALNRAGQFTLRITLTDRLGKQTATFEAPLRVTAP